MIRGVRQLTARSQFSLVAYNTANNEQVWSNRPRRATSAAKANAVGWVESLAPIEDHCMIDAMLLTLQIAKKARTQRRNKTVIFMYNRQPWCGWSNFGNTAYGNEVVLTYTGANTERLRTNVVHIPEWTHEQGDAFGQSLAAANNGKFTRFVEQGFNN